MYFKIFGKKDGKAYCYPVDDVTENNFSGYTFRDVKDNTYHNCASSELVEDPISRGKAIMV